MDVEATVYTTLVAVADVADVCPDAIHLPPETTLASVVRCSYIEGGNPTSSNELVDLPYRLRVHPSNASSNVNKPILRPWGLPSAIPIKEPARFQEHAILTKRISLITPGGTLVSIRPIPNVPEQLDSDLPQLQYEALSRLSLVQLTLVATPVCRYMITLATRAVVDLVVLVFEQDDLFQVGQARFSLHDAVYDVFSVRVRPHHLFNVNIQCQRFNIVRQDVSEGGYRTSHTDPVSREDWRLVWLVRAETAAEEH